jgi:thiosulfate dehydrogenase
MKTRPTRTLALLLLAAGLGAGCGGEELVPASTFGAKVFSDPALSTSPFNTYACSTCHEVSAPGPATAAPRRIDPGYNLYDVLHRPSWWGGERSHLLDAINYCLLEFMGGRELKPDEPQARQLYEYLAANSPDDSAPALPITVVKAITGLAELTGDTARGKTLWDISCARCHGEPHTGKGAIGRASLVPELSINAFGDKAREVIIEKVRHGKFFHIGGIMPLYSVEILSDQQLVDIVTYLGL